mgnify:CR=1 FL=1
MNRMVFGTSVGVIVLLLLCSFVATDQVGAVFTAIQNTIIETFGWFYVTAMTGFLLFAFWLMGSRYGAIRLGPDDAAPEFSRLTWFAMLFSAGMGIGLLFYSVAEPIMHYTAPPVGDAKTAAAAQQAMGITFFHWGLHPWALYAVVGLSLAYFSFRRGLPLSIRSAFQPLLGDRIQGGLGDAIDILAVVSTLFGVATSLGLGAMQVNAGIEHLFGVTVSIGTQMVIITVITLMATASVVTGLKAGVRRLSEINMTLAGLLLLFVFVVGPTAALCGGLVENVFAYVKQLPQASFWTSASNAPQQKAWLGSWTVFYWAWWIAWAPFVGMFIARVSKGRTIREFLVAVLLAPTFTGFVWLTVFGNTALHLEQNGTGGIADTVSQNLPAALYVLLDQYPLAGVTGLVCTVCVILFFVTSSDSASLVIDTIASGGQEEPPMRQRVFWAIFEGGVAASLLFVGGLKALQAASLATALPFCVLIILMCVALVRGLRADTRVKNNEA